MRKRIPHIIKSNKTTEMPTHFVFFDTETKEVPLNASETKHELKLGVLAYMRSQSKGGDWEVRYSNFKTIGEFWDFVFGLCHPKHRIYLVSHNIQFDFRVLAGFQTLRDAGWELKTFIINGVTCIFKFKRQTTSLVVLDNLNFFKLPLAILGKSIGLDKMPMPKPEEPEDKWFDYCKRDVEVLVKAWQTYLEFILTNDLGTFAPTLAGQAFNAFRHRFMKRQIYVHNFDRATELERLSYHGGRTECFAIGKFSDDAYHYLDINSAYPYVMSSEEYPLKFLKLVSSPSLSFVKQLLKDYALIGRFGVQTPEPVFGIVKDNRLIFPTGKFYAYLTTREIAYAVLHGTLREAVLVAVYKRGTIFRDYVNWFFTARLKYRDEGNLAFAFLCKIFLNSLYGKFGQRIDVFEKVCEKPEMENQYWIEHCLCHKEQIVWRVINGIVEKKVGKREGFHSFPAIAAHVAADARMLLWQYILTAGRENVLYSDTDSLFANTLGYEKLKSWISESQLGRLACKDIAPSIEIRGLKDYRFGDRETIKGISSKDIKIDDNTFKQVQFEGLRGGLRKKRLDEMVVRIITKTLTRDYKKGIVLDTGRVIPFELSEF